MDYYFNYHYCNEHREHFSCVDPPGLICEVNFEEEKEPPLNMNLEQKFPKAMKLEPTLWSNNYDYR